MAPNINQNGNFHTPLSPMRFQSSMGKEVRRRYKDGKNMVRLSLAKVTKVNYKYNTVEIATIKSGDATTHNPNDNGKFSARLPIQFGGTTPDGKVYGTNTLVTVGALVLIGFLEGNKNNPIVLNIYGAADNESMLTRTTYTSADESDESLQQELWQLFSLYPSMTYKNIDGHGNQEITFPGKTFFYASADDAMVNDVYFDYSNLPSSTYANGDSIEPISPEAPNMLYVHQAIYDKHRLTFFIKSDGTLRIGSRHLDGGGVTFMQMNTDGSFKIMQANDTIDPELESTSFSSFSIEEDGTIILSAKDHVLSIGENGILLDGSAGISGATLDLSGNQTVKDIQGNVTKLQEATTTDGIMTVVTGSTGWTNMNNTVNSKNKTYTSQPQPPYNVGDTWENSGSIYVCTNPQPVGSNFAQTDWTLAGDVTANGTSKDTSSVGGTSSPTVLASISSASNSASAAQTIADSKSATYTATPTVPYSIGDLWQKDNGYYTCINPQPAGGTFNALDWVLSADITSDNTAADTSKVGGTGSSTVLGNITSAQNTASSAQTTANSKAKTFTAQPTVPYNEGDVWNTSSGQIYICLTSRSTGSYTASDWVLASDITANNTAKDTSAVNGTTSSTITTNITNAQNSANSAQTTANSKAKTFTAQPVPPYNAGDMWKNGSAVYVCTTARSSGSYTASDWILSGDVTSSNTSADTSKVNGTASSTITTNITNAQNTANAKAQGFVTQPIPPYNKGDVWSDNGTVYSCTTSRSSGSYTSTDWTLMGDVTGSNTSANTNAVGGTSSSTVLSNITNAQNSASSASSSASSAQTTANSAQSLASSKTETFVSQPVPPYNKGDIWIDNGQTYVANITRPSTATFLAADWNLAADVTSQNTSADTSAVNGTTSSTVITNITAAQNTANSKAYSFLNTPATPYNVGDLWNNSGKIYICNTAKLNTGVFAQSDWTLQADVTASNTSADTSAVNGTTSSTVITNITTAQNTANSANTAASNAQTTATSKAKGFIAQPAPPYSTGDIWNNNGTVYICTTAKASGTSYALSDWTLSGDVTANNTAKDTSAVNGTTASTVITNITNAQNTANSKAKGFISQPVPPYNTGDVWNNNGTVYICTTTRSTGSYTSTDWKLSGDVTASNTSADTSKVNGTTSSTVITNITNAQNTANSASTSASTAQTTANSKAQGFISQPVPPYNTGDVWNNNGTVYLCTTAKASGTSFSQADWTLAGDVTANNTSADTSKVNGTTSSTVITNITNAQNSANSASTSASNAQTSANTAQTTANSKAQTFTSQPTSPYSSGDMWKNGAAVYVSTVTRSSGSYTASDWVLSGDVTANNTSADTSKVNGTTSSTVITNITTAQNTANAKAQTFTATPTVPYNVGDIYKNGSTVYVCTTAKASGGTYASSDWTLVGDVTSQNTAKDTSAVNGTTSSTVITNITNAQNSANSASTSASNAQSTANTAQSTANSKAQGFISQPVPPYNTGDVWNNSGTVYVCTTAKASGTAYALSDWTLVGDVTANNTSADTSKVNGTTSSTVITNITTAQNTANSASTSASNAQTSANTAQTTANSKAQTFTNQPVPPYNVGDMWKSGAAVYVCTTAKASGTSYASSDWILSGDVTSSNTSADTSAVNGTTSSTVITNITNAQNSANSASTSASNAQTTANSANTAASNAQTTANSKAKTFTATPTIPYSVGDLYKNGQTTYICTTARSSGSYTSTDWILSGDVTSLNTAADTSKVNGTTASTVITNITTAQNTANSKAQTFTATPTVPYNVGDIYKNGSTVYVCTTAKATGGTYASSDWTLVGDVTANNTSADTSKVNGTSSSTITTNITTAQNTANSASTSASNAQTSANNAQTTANSKAQTFTSQPVPPYNIGDMWKSGAAVYVCTTAKASGGTYASTDFVLSGDVTSSNTANDTTNVNGTASGTVITNITSASNSASAANTAASNAQTTANSANTAASNAQTTANSKSATFTSTPTIPYSVGDLYKNGSTVYICTTARSSGSYTSTDFVLAGDVTANNTAADTSKVNGTTSSTVITNITTAQNTANSKSATFTSTPVPPYSLGDIYKNGSTVYICTTAKATGGTYASTDFVLVGDVTGSNTSADTSKVNGTTSSTVITNITTAQNTANSKSATFTSTPVPPYSLGDLYKNGTTVYMCTTARSSGSYVSTDFTLVGDVTSQNTAKDTSAVNGTTASTVITNITNAQNTANSASTAASNAQSTANNIQVGGVNLLDNSSIEKTSTNSPANEFMQYADLSPLFNQYGLVQYTISFDIKSANTSSQSTMSVYCQDGSGSQYSIGNTSVPVTTSYTRQYVVVTPTLSSGTTYTTSQLAFYGTYGTGNIPTVKNVKVELGNKPTTWSPSQADVSAYADTTANTNANNAINNLVIGGRNYVKNTFAMQDLTNWSLDVGSSITATLNVINDSVYQGVINLNVAVNSTTSGSNFIVFGNTGLTLPNAQFTVGNTYTLSFLMQNDLVMYVMLADETGANPVATRSSDIPKSSTWRKVVYTFTATATGNTPMVYFSADDTADTGNVYVTEVQLEDGPKASGYSPAPEDVNNSISSVSDTVSSIVQGVFPTDMGNAIVSQVTSSTDYTSTISGLVDKQSYATDQANTSSAIAQAKSDAESHADNAVAGIDFSPYVKSESLTQTTGSITAQFTQSGGVNMLVNSVGYSSTDFWTVTPDTNGSAQTSNDPSLALYGTGSGFALNGAMIQQLITVTPNVPYTLGVILNKDISGDAYIKLDDGQGNIATQDFPDGTAYNWPKPTVVQNPDGSTSNVLTPYSISVVPTSSQLTVTLYGAIPSVAGQPAVIFTCAMLNVGTQPFQWQMHMGEAYNTNVTFNANGIRVSHRDGNTLTGYTVMTYDKFAGYQDVNGDGTIDETDGSVDEIFRMDSDTFVMKSATIGPVKILPIVSGNINGIAFIASS